jgi:hypothetical protein
MCTALVAAVTTRIQSGCKSLQLLLLLLLPLLLQLLQLAQLLSV